MIRMKKTKKEKKAEYNNTQEFIDGAKADNVKKKIFNFNLCEESVKLLEELSFRYKVDSYSYVIEKILKRFCTLEDEQKDFALWKESFKFPETHRINRTYYLEPVWHNCLVKIKRKFRIRYKSEMLRLLLFYYYNREDEGE